MKSMKLLMAFSMLVFGSVGLFVRRVPMTSAQISLLRGLAGGFFLLAGAALAGGGVSWARIRANLKYLIVAGSAMGLNWIFLFESFRRAGIAAGTICYYLAPAFVLALAPRFLHERLSRVTALCVAASLCGLVCVAAGNGGGGEGLPGIACGVAAAVFYAVSLIGNKLLRGITPYESTSVVLFVSALFLAPYVLGHDGLSFAALDGAGAFCLATLCLFHTGFTYLLYFAALRALPAQTSAVLSYIEPVSAVLMSCLLLGESLTPTQWLGGALILGATFVNELCADLPKKS